MKWKLRRENNVGKWTFLAWAWVICFFYYSILVGTSNMDRCQHCHFWCFWELYTFKGCNIKFFLYSASLYVVDEYRYINLGYSARESPTHSRRFRTQDILHPPTLHNQLEFYSLSMLSCSTSFEGTKIFS